MKDLMKALALTKREEMKNRIYCVSSILPESNLFWEEELNDDQRYRMVAGSCTVKPKPKKWNAAALQLRKISIELLSLDRKRRRDKSGMIKL